jgi:8-oxo-dGTP pyrophosphatase MutT (NUDIX family)
MMTVKTKRDELLQVAALPWRQGEAGLEVMMITSRETQRWVIPKGGRMRGLSDPEAAAQEAYEEAGVQGDLNPEPIGEYHYDKRLKSGALRPCRVMVYPLEVFIQLGAFPEAGQRDLRWMSPPDAAEAVDEADLAELIRGFSPKFD